MTGPRIGRRRAALAAAGRRRMAGEAGRGACPARRLSDAPAPPGRHLPAGRRDRHRGPHHRRGPGTEARPAGGGGEPRRRRRQHRRAGGRGGGAGRLHPAARHRRDARGEPGALREFRRRRGARLRHGRHHQRHGERALGQPEAARREDRGGAGRDRQAPAAWSTARSATAARRTFRRRCSCAAPASRRRTCPIAAPRRRWRRCSPAEFDFLFDTTATSTAHVRSGAFRALAVTTAAPRLRPAGGADDAGGGDRRLRPLGLERALRPPAHAASRCWRGCRRRSARRWTRRRKPSCAPPSSIRSLVPTAELPAWLEREHERWMRMARDARLTAD